MLAEARDVWATFFLERRLGILREAYMLAVIENRTPGSDHWAAGEESILKDLKSNHYGRQIRKIVRPGADGEMSDDEDYAGRTQKLLEQALWLTHRKLVKIPFVGQPEYAED